MPQWCWSPAPPVRPVWPRVLPRCTHLQPITTPREVPVPGLGCPSVPGCSAPLWGGGAGPSCQALPYVSLTGIMESVAVLALLGHSQPASQSEFLNFCVRAAHVKLLCVKNCLCLNLVILGL